MRFGLAAASWTDPTLVVGQTPVQAVHLEELRTALAEVYTTAGRTPPTYTASALAGKTTVISVGDITELRAALLAMWWETRSLADRLRGTEWTVRRGRR